MKSLIIFTMLVAFLFNTMANAMVPDQLISEIERKRIEYKIPGASIAVIQNGKIIWTEDIGYADISAKRPVTADTLFQAASITKTLTSVAVLKVLASHNIALDEPVNRYLKDWQIPENQYTKKVAVTFRMLLNHTAAISNPYPDGGYKLDQTLPTLLQVYKGQKPATNPALTVVRVPGAQYEYCNGCYAILQGALESITQMSYPELMHQEVLKPAGMNNSSFNDDFFINDPSKIALPYDPELQRYQGAPIRSPILSTGSLWTNATDLAKFAILSAKSFSQDTVLISKQLADELILPSGKPTHGLGFFIGDKYGNEKECGRFIYHSGANVGYLTLLIISKDGKNGAVILINVSPKWDAKEYPQFAFIKDSIKLIGSYYNW